MELSSVTHGHSITSNTSIIHKSNMLATKPTTSSSSTATTLVRFGHCTGVHTEPFHATSGGTASRAKDQEAVNFLEKKMDGMKDYDLDMTVTTAIMCLETVLGSDFIMEGFMCQHGREMLALSQNCT
eukprot:7748508-Ditylum_brightwellii.AAC.1